MTREDERKYCEAFHVKRVDRSCGTCKHFERKYSDCGCTNMTQAGYDSDYWESEDLDERTEYGAYGFGVDVDEGFVCDLWEPQPANEGNAP